MYQVENGVVYDPVVRHGCLSRALQLFGINIPLADYPLTQAVTLCRFYHVPVLFQLTQNSPSGVLIIHEEASTTPFHAVVYLASAH